VGANVGANVLLIISIALSTIWRKSLSPTSPSVVFIFAAMVVVVKLDTWQLCVQCEICNTYAVLENIRFNVFLHMC